MKRLELVHELAREAGISPGDAHRALDALRRIAWREARNGFSVPGIGTLAMRREPGRTVQAPGGKVVEFDARDLPELKISYFAELALRDGFRPYTDYPPPAPVAAPSHDVFRQWKQTWDAVAKAVVRKGGTITDHSNRHPAAPDPFAGLDIPLPADFAAFVRSEFASLRIAWSLPDGIEAPDGCENPYGVLAPDLGMMAERVRDIRHALERCDFEHLEAELLPDQIADLRSRTFVPFIEVGNGDCICLDISRETGGAAVAYLDHERDFNPYYATRLGSSFTDFMSNWARVCFVGPDLWPLTRYLDRGTGSLDPKCADAVRWRTWLLE